MRADRRAVPRNRKRGFTLLEAAVAMTIVGLVAVGALGAFGADLRAAAKAQEALPAAALAEERLARLELLDVRQFSALPESLATGWFAAPFSGYEWRASLAPVASERSLYEMTVTVQWRSGSYTLARRRFRPGPSGRPSANGVRP
jgi:prepilin-type N-terminal cleavage/methylation domain-containing protein